MNARKKMCFGEALALHYGLKTAVQAKLEAGALGMFSADVKIAITHDDMAAIVAIMDGRAPAPKPEPEQEPVSAHFDPPATDDDLARFSGVPRIMSAAETSEKIAQVIRSGVNDAVRRGLRNP